MRGDIDGSSFAFVVADDGEAWTPGQNGEPPTREITKIGALMDVSPVTHPAYESTSAEARAQAEIATATPEPAEDAATLQRRDQLARHQLDLHS